jgi:hypothetical protein
LQPHRKGSGTPQVERVSTSAFQHLPQFAGRDIQLRLQGDPVSSPRERDVPLPLEGWRHARTECRRRT